MFPEWETFYVVVGGAAGALTGLMFVVMALVADYGGSESQIEAFGTPTVVHFSSALFLSAIMSAPWPAILGMKIVLAMFGAGGAIYTIIVLRRARRQTRYAPVFEDWLFHAVLPLAGYLSILIASWGLARDAMVDLFVTAAAALLLLAIGIHNAWDTVTYVVVARWEKRQKTGETTDQR